MSHTHTQAQASSHNNKLGKAMKMKKKNRLPEELIVEILVKLPVKSLLCFRCVCKSWFDLIKSPNFIGMHLKHHSTTKNDERVLIVRGLEDETKNLLSFHDYETLSSVISSPHLEIPHFNDMSITVCGTCNGLICLSHEKTIVLCNPAMREFKLLPPSPFPCPETKGFCVISIGLGFDSNTNDYKVVALVNLRRKIGNDFIIIYRAEIYNLSTNSWRQICPDMPSASITPSNGILLNGALHWIAYDKAFKICIVSFDMSTEVFREMKLPDIDVDIDPNEEKGKRLMVLNESIALFAYTDPFSNPEQYVDIWVMHEYGVAESWTKEFIVGPLAGMCWPIFCWKNEVILLLKHTGRLVTCALDTHELNDFDINGIPHIFRVMVYQESLVSII